MVSFGFMPLIILVQPLAATVALDGDAPAVLLFCSVRPTDAVAREVMCSHAKRLHRILSPANGKVVRIIAGESLLFHALMKPTKIVQARIQRFADFCRLPFLNRILIHGCGPEKEKAPAVTSDQGRYTATRSARGNVYVQITGAGPCDESP
jgi:hypothetical protein